MRPADTTSAELGELVGRAVAAAPLVAGTSPADRAVWLDSLATYLEKNIDELVRLADAETHLGVERLTAEAARAAGQLRFYAEVACEGSYLGVTIDEATASTPRLVRVRRPLGPVAVFGASNFPFAFSVLGNDTASAIASGCPVLVKAHPAHPVLSTRLGELALEALVCVGAPEGTFALVHGLQAGAGLVRADGIEAVAFTGSESGGLTLWRLANERARVIPVFAEMGTVNPVVVTPSAAIRMAEVAQGFVGSFTLGSGQFCTKPGLLLAPAGSGAAAAVGDALLAAAPRPVMLTRAIAESVSRGLGELRGAGASVVASVPCTGSGRSAPAAVLTAPISALREGSRLLEECFGAVALVLEYADRAELDHALNALQGCLAASVIPGPGVDPDVARLVGVFAARAGRVTVGDWPTGVAFTWAQHHGGPWPSTSNPSATSVGAAALDRFVRPVTYQSVPDDCLPMEARQENPWGLSRRVDGRLVTS